jgi:mannan endo-1,4-beta-mannosidase
MKNPILLLSLLLMAGSHAPGLAQPGPRPGSGLPCPPYCGFKTPAFQASGNTLLDPCGQAVVLKGVNKMAVFDFADPVGVRYFRQIAGTGANCVRIAWEMTSSNPADAPGTMNPLTRLDALIVNAKAARLIPVVGLWDFTGLPDGGFSRLGEYVAWWTRPDVLTLLRKHETALILNIGNEAATGDETNPADLIAFAEEYKTAITHLREAGIRVPLMIDGMDRGKSLLCFAAKGADIASADPLHNLIFSFHAYWNKTDTDAQPTFIRDAFAGVSTLPVPVVIGELSAVGAWPGSATVNVCSPAGRVDYRQFASRANAAGIGWLLWEWGPGNQWQTPGDCPQMDMTTNGTLASLTATRPTAPNAWAKELALTSVISIKNTARRTFFLNSGLRTCPH